MWLALRLALSWSVWLPALSAASVCGLVQVVQLPPSMRHAKVEPVSLELKVKVGVVLLDGSVGLVSIVELGGVLSRSEERRVGEGWGFRGAAGHWKKKEWVS